MLKKLQFLIFLIFFAPALSAHALLTIDINQGNIDPLPIAVPDFGADKNTQQLARDITELVISDLTSSGLLRIIAKHAYIQKISGVDTAPKFEDWRLISASALVAGSIKLTANNSFTAEFILWDVPAQQKLVGKRFTSETGNWRRVAHMIADQIYYRLTGESGYFDSRIVYVAETGPFQKRIKRLAIMDYDGANLRYLTDGKFLALTPRFSPTAQEVIYLSYQNKTPKVFLLNVDTKQSRLIGDFKNMTFAPRFSPDGKKIILSMSENGNSEIYTYDIKTAAKQRLTFNDAIDTSPSFSPDGKQIVFNSDRGGSQQLYIMDHNGNNVKRISFDQGRYGTPVWSPRGDYIAFTKMYKGYFYIGVMYPDGKGERLLTKSYLDEGPTFSPNGRTLMFARQLPAKGKNPSEWHLYSIDITGHNEKRIELPTNASDPAWSSIL